MNFWDNLLEEVYNEQQEKLCKIPTLECRNYNSTLIALIVVKNDLGSQTWLIRGVMLNFSSITQKKICSSSIVPKRIFLCHEFPIVVEPIKGFQTDFLGQFRFSNKKQGIFLKTLYLYSNKHGHTHKGLNDSEFAHLHNIASFTSIQRARQTDATSNIVFNFNIKCMHGTISMRVGSMKLNICVVSI